MRKNCLVKPICFIFIIYTLLFTLPAVSYAEGESDAAPALSDNVQIGSRLWDLLFGGDNKEEPITLMVGGGVFGVKVKQKYVSVSEAIGVPALKPGDLILSINGENVSSSSDVKHIVEQSGGESVTIRALHQGSEVAVEIRPTLQDGKYRLGISLRDSAAGLGTVTFVDPRTGRFGGLGHGICDADSGEVIAIDGGDALGVILGGIHRGDVGKPGELCGILTDRDLGDILINSECGVFGTLSDPSIYGGTEVAIATKDQVREGEATIISTLKNGRTAEYKVEIYDIDRDSSGSKSFRVRVTDDTLKALTGGIVRGMSGSPIIQDGRLVGAVTHVLVADPTEGYGIFIENMLNYSNISAQRNAA